MNDLICRLILTMRVRMCSPMIFLLYWKMDQLQVWTCIHYENLPEQYTDFLLVVKNENFQQKTFDIFLIFASNIGCGYMLEHPRRGGSNPQSMFGAKIKKK